MRRSRRQAASSAGAPTSPQRMPWWEYRFSLFTLAAVAFFVGSLGYGIGMDRGRQADRVSAPHEHEHEQASATGAPAIKPAVSEEQSERAIKGTTDVARLIEIGNHEFDADRPRLALLAYEKALTYQPNNPDVRTDLGIMYRRLGRFDEAIEQFERARKSSPRHENSRYNLGVVYMHDLNQYAPAIAAWEDYLRVAPDGQNAESARQGIAAARRKLSQSRGAG
ncbi:MAG: tetratricopeptide repeat protein [Armatimonadetes bacterium]|nr:tetratricopeptide repeat protein [Armatimonadota bacterium]